MLAVAVMCFMGKLAFTPSLPAGFGRSAQSGEAAVQIQRYKNVLSDDSRLSFPAIAREMRSCTRLGLQDFRLLSHF